jgi:hypothetical protein
MGLRRGAGWTGLFVCLVILRTAALRPSHMVGLVRDCGGVAARRVRTCDSLTLTGSRFLFWDAIEVE